jgi:hypothetical protein
MKESAVERNPINFTFGDNETLKSGKLQEDMQNQPFSIIKPVQKYYESPLTVWLLVFLALISFKTIVSIVLIVGLAFFSSVTDWIEVFTYAMTLITILVQDPDAKFSCASIAILAAFLVFAFLIEKLQVFGLFVLAFKKTLIKSATFMPVFFVLYAGFNISYRLRANFGVS